MREFLPLLGMLMTLGLFLLDSQWGLIPLACYTSVLFLSGLISSRRGLLNLVGVPLCLLLLHIGFTLGLLDGCLRKGRASRDR